MSILSSLGWLSTLVERWSHNPKVASSILAPGTFFAFTFVLVLLFFFLIDSSYVMLHVTKMGI